MTGKIIRQTMFTSGEVDVSTWKRTDVEQYLTAAQSLLNMEVGTTGLCRKRKGTSSAILASSVTGRAEIASQGYEFVDKYNRHYLCLTANNLTYIYYKSGTTLTYVQSVATPFLTADLGSVDYTQDNDSLIMVNPNYAPLRIYISNYNVYPAMPTFSWQYLNIYPLPAYDFNLINYNNFTVTLSVSGNQLTFNFVGVGANPGYDNSWIGGQIIGGGASTTQPIGYAIIIAVAYSAGGGGTVTFTATVQIPFQTSGYATSGNQYSIRQPAWSAALGYPQCTLYFQNRLWFANTQSLNNTIFGSKINAPISFDVGTGADTDAIIYTIGQTDAGAIEWLNGGKQLEVFCQNNEFACPQNESAGLTPGNFSIRQQSSYGAFSTLKPITYLNDSYYVTKSGNALMNFHYNGIGLTYASSNISAASSHLVSRPTNRALLRGSDTSQDNFVYFLNFGNGTITALQFAAEYKLAALTPVVFQEDVGVIDLVTIDNTVYILKYYTKTATYTLEYFDNNSRIDGTLATTMNSAGLITGLDIYNGYTVQVVFQNQDYGQYLVAGGQITVSNPHGYSGDVTVGFLYTNAVVPMYPASGVNESPFFKHVSRVYVDYYQSLDFSINGYLVPYQSYTEIQAQVPPAPKTDTAIVDPFYGWNRFDNNGVPIISITQASPFDLVITGIGYQIDAAVI